MSSLPRTAIALTALLALTAAIGLAQQSTPPPSNPAPLPDAPATQIQPSAPSPVPTGPTAIFETSMGNITCRLFDKIAPVASANFIALAEGTKTWTNPVTHQKMQNTPLYNGTIFHRVIPGFMIQGGDPEGDGMGGPGYEFKDEFAPDLNFDVPGRLAMANSGPDTNGSQFFITVAPQPSLDQNYTIFGQCSDASLPVADAIANVPRNDDNKPLQPVTLNKVVILPAGAPLPPLPSPPTPNPSSGGEPMPPGGRN